MDQLMRFLQAPVVTTAPSINCKNFPPACFSNFTDVGKIALPLLYLIATILVLIYGIRGAFKYINSAGDAKATEEARKTISYAVLGAIIIAVAFFATRLVASLFNIEFLL